MTNGANPRQANGSARRKLSARVKAQGRPCWICGREIDLSLTSTRRADGRTVPHPQRFELDEDKPVSRWREFGYPSPTAAALDPDNVGPSHRLCNQRKGNKTLEEYRAAQNGSHALSERSIAEQYPTSQRW